MTTERIFEETPVSTWLTDIIPPEQRVENMIRAQVMLLLQDFRHESGLTQKQLAEMLGVSQSLVSRWENGEENLTIATLARLAYATGNQVILQFEKVA